MEYQIKDYKSKLNLKETFVAIKFLKDNFENLLSNSLNLKRVSSPLFVLKSTGLNDDLNGYEEPVRFNLKSLEGDVEIVQSLAKWKRNALKEYGFNVYEGLYTDMNAIRKDEFVDNIHSIYVDQWDWELIIKKEDRNLDFLFNTVNKIYQCLLDLEKLINTKFPILKNKLPAEISFISTNELFNLYPHLSSKERENKYLKEHKAAFIYKIGYPLKNNMPHDGRASDYDDWNLNGDILVYDEVLSSALELSSMGIRVDKDSLVKQVTYKREENKLNTKYHQDILNDRLPLTIGGGIGQSRLCLFFLEKAHIGEVQASLWNEHEYELANKLGIKFL